MPDLRSPLAFALLRALQDHGPLTPRRLVEQIGAASGKSHLTLQALRRDGLLDIAGATCLTLSPSGRRALEAAQQNAKPDGGRP